MLNDARVASLGFFKVNVCTTRINKEKNFKIKFQVLLKFAQILPDYLDSCESRHLVSPDLGPDCLQIPSADDDVCLITQSLCLLMSTSEFIGWVTNSLDSCEN